MRIKPGVQIGGLQPEALLGACVLESVLVRHGSELTITSVREGTHMAGSLHGKGRAFDFRTRTVPPAALPSLLAEMREAVGAEFDLVLESDPPHGHLEFDPKTPEPPLES